MAADPLAQLGTALADRYRIDRELGQGGMATVYLAEDLKHGRKVALKVLKPELAAVLGADRFVVGIKTTAYLRAPSYRGYDLTRDDRSFVMLRVLPEASQTRQSELVIVDNWFTELKAKVVTK